MKELMKFFKDEDGQGMVEYGLIIGLIAIVVIVALSLLGPKVASMFNTASNALDNAQKNSGTVNNGGAGGNP